MLKIAEIAIIFISKNREGCPTKVKFNITKQILLLFTLSSLIPLQVCAEQLDAWTRADIVMECEVVRLEHTGLRCSVDFLSYYDGVLRTENISLSAYLSLEVGDVVPCALVAGKLVAIRGYDTELYRYISDEYQLEPVVLHIPIGVRVISR